MGDMLMSDVYLDLMARIRVMGHTAWTKVDGKMLDQRRKALGLTHLEAAEGAGTSERNWIRWLRTNQVPTRSVKNVARVLQLDFYEYFDSPVPITRNGTGEWKSADSAAIERLEKRVEDAVETLERVERALRDLQSGS